jgi:hypothetical protein
VAIGRQLGNTRLVKYFASLHPLPAELSASNVADELKFFESIDEVAPAELLTFTRNNFYRLTDVVAHQLKPGTLDLLFSQPMVLESEDSFLDFLKGEVENGCYDLLRHVELACLSSKKLEEFLELVDLGTVTPGVWERIRLLVKSIHTAPRDRSELHHYGFRVRPGDKFFDGIFAHLNRLIGGNCADKAKGIIDASDTNACCGTLSFIFADNDWSGGNYWHHNNVPNRGFKVDFRDRRVSVTHYAIHNSKTYVRERDFLKTWTLEGSNTGSDSDCDSDWIVIDSRSNDESLHGASKLQALFECNGDTQHAFRYLRLIQRGTSHDNSTYYFLISQIEIFGFLFEPVSGAVDQA